MPDYFNRNANAETAAQTLGFQEGHARGYASGRQQGHEEGYAAGHEDGRVEGWNTAIEECNKNLLQQMEFTRQHVADKEVLAQHVRDQNALLAKQQECLEQMERENLVMRKANGDLRDVVAALDALLAAKNT
jgi:flagellar biosynthesis/type III secretory pathway protein FliH